MASIYDLYIEQGSQFQQDLDLVGDFTGYTVAGTLKDSIGYVYSGIASLVVESEGTLRILISSTASASLSNGVGSYNIEIEDGSGVVDRILQGRIYVDGEVK